MKVLLDGGEAQTEEPKEFTVEKRINREDFVIEYQYPGDLVFVGKSYKKLLDARSASYCDLIDVDIQKQCGNGFKTIVEGEIRLTNIEFNHKECSATTKVKQRDLLARILNSWDKKTSVSGGQDLYGNSLTGLSPVSILFLAPFDDSPYGNIPCYDWLEAVQYYVDYLTGSALTVRSDWYNNVASTNKIYITSGLAIRLPVNTQAPVASLKDVYIDQAKAFNLLMGIVYNGNTPELRIEEEAFWFSSSVFTSKNELLDISDRYKEDVLYSVVKLGSSTFIKGDGTSGESLPAVPFFGFYSEEFAISNACNLDNSLDLVLDNIVDSNIIEDIIINDTESYDEDCFYIQVEGSNAYQNQGELLPVRSIFNKMYLKSEVIERYNFQGDVYRLKEREKGRYKAYYSNKIPSAVTTTEEQMLFPQTNPPTGFPGSTWNTSNSRFTAASDDLYQFRLQYLFRNIQFNAIASASQLFIRAYIRRFNSGGTPLQLIYGSTVAYRLLGLNQSGDIFIAEDNFKVYMAANDYLQFYISGSVTDGINTDVVRLYGRGTAGGVKYYQESECDFAFSGGGLVKKSIPNDYRVREWEFEDELSTEEMIDMIRHPQKGVQFKGTNVDRRTAWGDVETNIYNGETKFTLLSDSN